MNECLVLIVAVVVAAIVVLFWEDIRMWESGRKSMRERRNSQK